jgi:hypothetical protein
VAAFAVGEGIISQCIIKMAEYPITRIVYNDDQKGKLKDDQTEAFWKNVLEKNLNIMRLLREIGMDYYAYGNSIISISFPFRREIQCPRCKLWHTVDAINYKFRNFKFYARCKGTEKKPCGYDGVMEARDLSTKEISAVKVIKWDLAYVDIKYNNISGDHFYYYTIPDNMKTAIRRGDMEIVNGTRLEIIEACKRNKQVKLLASNLYHLKRSAPQYIIPGERGWGVPLIMPVMKDVFHNRILKKGNEMIAFDHIVPLRILFPTSAGDVSPHLTANLSGWKGHVEEELLKWRKDPNYISIVPFPLGLQSFGGDGRILMVTPEIKATEDDIIIGMGVIPEIIRGGASWSGSNVSLRVIENTFINHRTDMHNVIDFLTDKLSIYFDKAKIPIKMADFKMADDLQKKQMLMTNASASPADAMVSRTTALKELDFDPETEYKNREAELKKQIELKTKEAEGLAEAQGAATLVNALYTADAQMENQKRVEMHQKNRQQEQDDEANKNKGQNAQAMEQDAQAAGAPQGIQLNKLIFLLTTRFARLADVDPTEFKIRLHALKQSMPTMFTEVYRNLQEMNLIKADLIPDIEKEKELTADTAPGTIAPTTQGGTTAMDQPSPAEGQLKIQTIGSEVVAKPLPEQLPPRRVDSPI